MFTVGTVPQDLGDAFSIDEDTLKYFPHNSRGGNGAMTQQRKGESEGLNSQRKFGKGACN